MRTFDPNEFNTETELDLIADDEAEARTERDHQIIVIG